MSMADLLIPWRETPALRWVASYQTAGPVLLLTAFIDRDGLWHAVVELKYNFGPEWKAPSPFATAELAKQWAEAEAEKLRDFR